MDDADRLYCLRLIQRKRRTTQEIRQSLSKKELPESDIDDIVNFLVQAGLLNDQAYAEAWIHDRDLFNPRSRFVLKQELSAKGVPEAIIDNILAQRETSQEDPEISAGRALLERKANHFRGIDQLTARRRQQALLQRRGFSYDTIRRILDV